MKYLLRPTAFREQQTFRWHLLMRLASAGLVLLFILSACQTTASSGTRRKLTIAWVTKSLGNPVFDLGRSGALKKAEELTAAGPIDVEVLVSAPASADAIEQTRILDDLIARGVDGIAVSCNEPASCIAPINRATAAGIPVMTWDSDSPQSQRFTFLSIDNYAAGQQAADLLAQAINQQGKVAILTGVPGALNLEQRVQGFNDRLAEKYPEMQVVNTIASNEDINLGVQGIEETMQAHPDLRGWFFAGMWPLFADRGALVLWEEATRNGGLKTVAFDTLPLELELLQDGYLEALIGQKYWGWGYDSIQLIYDRIVSNSTSPTFIDTGVDIVTRNNAAAMQEAWTKNDFSQPLPPP